MKKIKEIKLIYKIILMLIINLFIYNQCYNALYYKAYIKGQEDIFNALKTKKTSSKIADDIIYKRDSLSHFSLFGKQFKKL